MIGVLSLASPVPQSSGKKSRREQNFEDLERLEEQFQDREDRRLTAQREYEERLQKCSLEREERLLKELIEREDQREMRQFNLLRELMGVSRLSAPPQQFTQHQHPAPNGSFTHHHGRNHAPWQDGHDPVPTSSFSPSPIHNRSHQWQQEGPDSAASKGFRPPRRQWPQDEQDPLFNPISTSSFTDI